MKPEELRRIRILMGRIDLVEEQIERLRASIERTSPKLDGMPRSGSERDAMAEYVAKLEDLQDRHIELLGKSSEELISLMDEITAKCSKKQASVILYRYKDGMTWEQVTEEMGATDVRTIMRLHKRALKNLKK